MKTTHLVPSLTLVVGLALSSIAAYYSILGLTVIFTGGLIGFITMEIAKVVSTLWLHKHWNDKIGALKYTLSSSVIILMLITSLGTFGYLSKASLDKGSSVAVNSAVVTNLENSIQLEQKAVDQNIKQIQIYSDTIGRLITDDPLKASRERRNLQFQIQKLSEENRSRSANINKYNKELLPYSTEIKKHEVEVGPLLYLTKLIYGDEYKLYTEKTLSWLIITIVLVFDPLAIMMLIASQQSFYLIRGNSSVTTNYDDIINDDEIFEDESEKSAEEIRREKMQAKKMQM